MVGQVGGTDGEGQEPWAGGFGCPSPQLCPIGHGPSCHSTPMSFECMPGGREQQRRIAPHPSFLASFIIPASSAVVGLLEARPELGYLGPAASLCWTKLGLPVPCTLWGIRAEARMWVQFMYASPPSSWAWDNGRFHPSPSSMVFLSDLLTSHGTNGETEGGKRMGAVQSTGLGTPRRVCFLPLPTAVSACVPDRTAEDSIPGLGGRRWASGGHLS